MALFGQKDKTDQQGAAGVNQAGIHDDDVISSRPLLPDDDVISSRPLLPQVSGDKVQSSPPVTVPITADSKGQNKDVVTLPTARNAVYIPSTPYTGYGGGGNGYVAGGGYTSPLAWKGYDPTPAELCNAQINEKVADTSPDWVFEEQDHGFIYTYPPSWKKRDRESGIWVATPLPDWAGDRHLSLQLLRRDKITGTEGVGGYATGARTARQECLTWLKYHDWQWKECAECTDGFVVEDFDNLDLKTVSDADICFFCDGLGQRWAQQWLRVRGVRAYSDEKGVLTLKSGEYGFQESDESWYAKPPGHSMGGCLAFHHTVIEHPDKTITVQPSVVVPPLDPSKVGEGWHGLLTKGEWVKF